MQQLAKLALAGVAAAAIAGTATAATADKHVMDVALPDGGTAHIEYYGDIAPKVTIAPGPFAPLSVGWAPMAFPDFRDFDRMFEQLDRQREALMNRVRQMSRIGGPDSPANLASYGSVPAGMSSVSVVTVSNGGGTCTRTTEVTSQGEGKPPKVVTKVSGTCGPASAAPTSAAPAPHEPLDHT